MLIVRNIWVIGFCENSGNGANFERLCERIKTIDPDKARPAVEIKPGKPQSYKAIKLLIIL